MNVTPNEPRSGHSLARLPLLAALVLGLGCSGESGAPSDQTSGPGGGLAGNGGSGLTGGGLTGDVDCTAITLASGFRFSQTANSGWFTGSIAAGFSPEVEEGWQGVGLRLDLRQGVALSPGVFDLAGEPPNSADCSACLHLSYAGSGDNFELALAMGGTLELSEFLPDDGVMKATLRDVTFRHLGIVGLHAFEGLHEDGRCFTLATGTIDTSAREGDPCLESGDCPNAKLTVCDPATGTCALTQCSEDSPSCANGGTCQIQDPFFGAGACYMSCTPFSSGACPEGQECIPNDYVGARGVCKRQGPEAPEPVTTSETGRSCEPWQVATGCGPGHVCTTHAVYWHYDHCFRQCDYFADDPGCRCWLKLHDAKDIDTTYLCGQGDCHFGGVCAESDDTLGFGDPCGDRAASDECLGDDRRSGVCMPDAGGPLYCRRLCRLTGDDCAAGERCLQMVQQLGGDDERVIEGVGYCAP